MSVTALVPLQEFIKPKPKPKPKVVPKQPMQILKKKASDAAKRQQAAVRKRVAKPKMIDVVDLSSPPKKPVKKKKLSFLERLKQKGLISKVY